MRTFMHSAHGDHVLPHCQQTASGSSRLCRTENLVAHGEMPYTALPYANHKQESSARNRNIEKEKTMKSYRKSTPSERLE